MDLYKNFNDKEWRNSRRRILVIRDGLIGDTVFITPLLRKLSNLFPNAGIDVVAGNKSPVVLNNFPKIGRIYRLPKKFSILRHIVLFISLRLKRYDLAFVQEVNSHYVLMARLTGAKILIGYNNKLKNLLDFYVDRSGHAVLAEQQHINELTKTSPVGALLITTEQEDIDAVNFLQEKGLDPSGNIFCFQPTCSEPNSVREWIPSRWAELGDELVEKFGGQIIFNGAGADVQFIERIRSMMKYPSVSIAGNSGIRMLISIIKKTRVVIGVDTGTLHIANAVGVPVIMLMGYSVPEDTGPFDLSGLSRIIRGSLPCIPCKYTEPKPAQWEYCKANRPAACMDEIKSADVLNAVSEILLKLQTVPGK